jgi:MYND finger
MFPFWNARFPLPKSCGCGDTEAQSCPGSGFENHRNFPPFRDLPDENDVSEGYYTGYEPGMHRARRHWILAGEIVDCNFFIRPKAKIRTRYGEEILVNFHLDVRATCPKYFECTLLKPGNSMLILYAYRRTFLDMNEGIRQENLGTVMVFSAGLASITSELWSHAFRRLPGGAASKCFACQAGATSEVALKKCSRCKLATYCGRECQGRDLKQTHKGLCSQAQTLSHLAAADFDEFDGYLDWSFQREVLSDEQRRERAVDARYDYIRRVTGTEPLSKSERLRKC